METIFCAYCARAGREFGITGEDGTGQRRRVLDPAEALENFNPWTIAINGDATSLKATTFVNGTAVCLDHAEALLDGLVRVR